MSQWYYSKAGQQLGPVTREQLADMVAQAVVTTGDLVWTEGMGQWEPAATHFPSARPPAGYGTGYASSYAPQGAYATPATVYGYQGPTPHAGMVRFAGFWIRFCAWLLDVIIMSIVGGILGVIFGIILGLTGNASSMDDPAVSTGINLISFALALTYEAGMIALWGATIGKMAIGARVVRTSGEKVTLGRAIGRYFAKILSGIILCIGYIMIAFNNRKQGLHDNICDTIVVYK